MCMCVCFKFIRIFGFIVYVFMFVCMCMCFKFIWIYFLVLHQLCEIVFIAAHLYYNYYWKMLGALWGDLCSAVDGDRLIWTVFSFYICYLYNFRVLKAYEQAFLRSGKYYILMLMVRMMFGGTNSNYKEMD